MIEFTLKPRPPFDFASTARFFRFTEAEAVDRFHEGAYLRALHLDGQLHVLQVAPRGAGESRALAVRLPTAEKDDVRIRGKAAATVRRMFTLDHDLAAWRAQVRRDPLMRRLEEEHRGLHLACWPTLFEALVISILSQQISTAAAWTLKRRLVERYGESLAAGGQTFYAFPRAEKVAAAGVESLRALGLSGAKVVALRELARACAAGTLDAAALEKEDNASLIARLTGLRGVGRWTAEWALMLHFGRADVFPAGDLFLRGAVVKYYNKGAPLAEREIRALAARRWGRWSSYAAAYLLAGMRAGTVILK